MKKTLLRMLVACSLGAATALVLPTPPAVAWSCPGSVTFAGGTPQGVVNDPNVTIHAAFTGTGPGFMPDQCDLGWVTTCDAWVDDVPVGATCAAQGTGDPQKCPPSACQLDLQASVTSLGKGTHAVRAVLGMKWGCCGGPVGPEALATGTWQFSLLDACSDGLDNDGDGQADYPNDFGCASADDNDEHSTLACDDTLDNDGDGLADYPADPGCASQTDTDERRGTACDNGADDDGDGAADYPTDIGCSSGADTDERGTVVCDNGADDDGDGAADFPADPGCAGPSDASERGTLVCDDGLDNDGDGTSDSPGDPGCADVWDASERGTIACDDTLDNDGDGTADYPADPGCTGPADTDEHRATACDDGVDNDGDGRVDYPLDPGCSSPIDTDEAGTCGENAPGVVVCVIPGSEALRVTLYAYDTVPTTPHHVAGYVDAYKFVLPGAGTVVLPCVVLVTDVGTVNPCAAAGGTWQERRLTLVDQSPSAFLPEEGAPLATVRVCHADVVATVLGFGLTSFPGYALC